MAQKGNKNSYPLDSIRLPVEYASDIRINPSSWMRQPLGTAQALFEGASVLAGEHIAWTY